MLTKIAFRSFFTRPLHALNIPKCNPNTGALIRNVLLNSFHSGTLLKKEDQISTEAVVNKISFIEKYELNDWKITAPIAVAIAIPAIHNQLYILNEETQLAACFFLFCTSVYKFGGEAITGYFNARQDAILAEYNKSEDEVIDVAKKLLDVYESITYLEDESRKINEYHKDIARMMCKINSYKCRHEVREIFENNLKYLISSEADYKIRLQQKCVEYAVDKVKQAVSKGGKDIKESAFKSALNSLSDEKIANNKNDAILSLFIKYMNEYKKNLEDREGKIVKLTDSEQKKLDEYVESVLVKNKMMDFVDPKEIKTPFKFKIL